MSWARIIIVMKQNATPVDTFRLLKSIKEHELYIEEIEFDVD